MSCRCRSCRSRQSVRQIAPRLARAHDQIIERRPLRRRAAYDLLRAERLLAHRDLQLVRSGTTANPGYIHDRQRKLEQAKRLVEACRRSVQEAA